MVYFKLLLNDKRSKADNIYPLVVRVTHERNNTTFNTGIRVDQIAWDANSLKIRPSYPNADKLNRNIIMFYGKIQGIALVLESEGNFSFQELKKRLNREKSSIKSSLATDFKSFAFKLVADMLSINKAGNAIIYQTATNKLMAFANNPKLKFTDITYAFLEGFQRQLIKDGLKPNSISNYFRTLRAIYNKAIREKMVDRSHYPFLDITVKTERTAKRAISVEELINISNLDLNPKSQEWKARCYFLLSFALRGASFTDLAYLKPESIEKDYIVYRRRKTGKRLRIKLLPYTTDLLENLKGLNSKYLIPVLPGNIIEDSLNAKKLIYQWIKTTNKYLNRIAESNLTTYVTRHTWATMAKKLGYSNEVIAEALGHEYGNKITNIYLDNFDQATVDEVNERILENLKLA
jgi:integrase/recombinase XerD